MHRSAFNTRYAGTACIALLAALTAACTATTGTSGDGSGPSGSSTMSGGNDNGAAGNGGGGAGATGGATTSNDASSLTCDAVALCSSYWVLGTAAALPARTGGTIPDGRYSLVDILSPKTSYESLREVLVVRGGSYRATGNLSGGGGVGTFHVDNAKLTMKKTRYCRPTGEASDVVAPSDSDAEAYDYTVDGDRLYVFADNMFSHDGVMEPAALVYERFDGDLCASPGASTCTIKSCFCASKVGGTLTDSACNLQP